MYLKSNLIYLYTESPLHAGAGSGLGAIDLPIQRERYTGYPIIQSSGLKGALRSHCPAGGDGSEDQKKFLAAFGPENAAFAGAFGVGDARILLYPVRSLAGVFAWITCPDILQRWQREALSIGVEIPELPAEPGASQCYAGAGVQINQSVVLEEYTFKVKTTYDLKKLVETLQGVFPIVPDKADPKKDRYQYWKTKLGENLVILRNDEFRDLVMHTTEVLTRVRLDRNTKTAANQALWTEEHLPSDTLMYAPVRAMPMRVPLDQAPADWKGLPSAAQAGEVLKWVSGQVNGLVQIGGDETVGRGLARLTWKS